VLADNYLDFGHTIPMTNPGMTQLRMAVVKALTQPSAERCADPVIDASPDPSPLGHPAIALCMAAYERARLSARSRHKCEYDSSQEALAAYKAAMPALISRQNISDYIACVAYADLRGLIYVSETDHLLNIARTARLLHTARSAPIRKPSSAARPARSAPASPATAQNTVELPPPDLQTIQIE
jgi:hypothetical protein